MKRCVDWGSRRLACAAALAAALTAPMQLVGAQTQNPSDTPPSPAASAGSAESKPSANAARPHRVITNDELPSRTAPGSTPEIEEWLERVNFCDDACFKEIAAKTSQELAGTVHRQLTEDENHRVEDALLNRIEKLRANEEWQNLLRSAIGRQIWNCREGRAASPGQQEAGRSVTRADLQTEEEQAKKNVANKPPPYAHGAEALIDYRWKYQKDPLLFAWTLHQYYAIVKEPCSSFANPDR